jgi:hypothetical protein
MVRIRPLTRRDLYRLPPGQVYVKGVIGQFPHATQRGQTEDDIREAVQGVSLLFLSGELDAEAN